MSKEKKMKNGEKHLKTEYFPLFNGNLRSRREQKIGEANLEEIISKTDKATVSRTPETLKQIKRKLYL